MVPNILRFLAQNYPDAKKKVIIGMGFRNIEQIESAGDRATEFVRQPDASEISGIFSSSDVVITAGGQTLYELARVGTPAIAITVAENQTNNVKTWHKIGFAEDAGLWSDKDLLDRIGGSLSRLKENKHRFQRSTIGKRLVDGRGPRRIRDILIRTARKKAVTISRRGYGDLMLRPATESDSGDILAWRNSPAVRKNCFQKDPIAQKEHDRWFSARMNDNNVRIYLALLGQKKAGVIRFEPKDGALSVSVHLNPSFLGKGIGTELIRQGTAKCFDETGAKSPILAVIKTDNIASQRAFSKAGYICVEKKRDRFVYEKKGRY
jgi:RimJ/RimL family protein N-acetyltransferase